MDIDKLDDRRKRLEKIAIQLLATAKLHGGVFVIWRWAKVFKEWILVSQWTTFDMFISEDTTLDEVKEALLTTLHSDSTIYALAPAEFTADGKGPFAPQQPAPPEEKENG